MNRKRAFLILFMGLVSGLVATVWAARYFSEAPRASPPPPQLESVILMKENVAQGEVLKKEHLERASWPAPLLPASAARRLEEVEGRVALSDLMKGEPVLLGKLAPEGSAPGLAASISPGMRAMTIRVNEVVGVAGFLLPGSRVDVLTTMEVEEQRGATGTVSKLVLQNVQVLAVGQRLETKDPKATKVSVVTLLVTPAQAERLSLAATKGSILLALRNNRDETSPDTPGVTPPQLIYGEAPRPKRGPEVRPAPKPAPAPTPAPARVDGIEVIRGGKRSLEAPPR